MLRIIAILGLLLAAHAARAEPGTVVSGCGGQSLTAGNAANATLDTGGSTCTTTTPSATTPVAGSQYGLTLASARTLTVPATARVAQVTIEGQNSRCTTDGTTTPTATVGTLYQVGSTVTVWTPALTNFKCIQTAASATLNVEYFK